MNNLLTLSNIIEIPIRFHEVDSMNIVWHGHYLKYFEIGRESLASFYGFSYSEIFKSGFYTPVIKSICQHKAPLKYGDTAVIETTWSELLSAKLVFSYKITRLKDGLICATGETTQVFTNLNGELQLICPDFFENWKMNLKGKLKQN